MVSHVISHAWAGLLEPLIHSTLGCFALFHALVALVLLVGVGLQQALLGDVKDGERDRVTHAAARLMLKNMFFIFYVLSPETLVELLFWLGWLCCLSLLKVLCEFCHLRVARLGHSPALSPGAGRKLAVFIALTGTLTGGFFLFVAFAFSGPGFQSMVLLLYEPFHMLAGLVQVAVRFALHLHCHRTASPTDEVGFVADIGFEVAKLGTTLAHATHVLMGFFSMSVVDLLLVMYIRHVVHRLWERVHGLWQYRRALAVLHAALCTASPEQLRQYADPCAICYDGWAPGEAGAGTAAADGPAKAPPTHLVPKALPCGHVFHLRCIRQWMEHQHSCPICKRELLSSSPCHAPRGSVLHGF